MTLENAKPGDKLWVVSSQGAGQIATVKRITPTGLVVAATGFGDVTFRPDGQERTSDTWLWRTAQLLTDEDVAEMLLDGLRLRALEAFSSAVAGLSEDQCRAIMRIIEKPD